MNKLQQLTLFTGSFGIILNIVALSLQIQSLGYLALFLSRISAFLYMVALDRLRYVYLVPASVSLLNVFYNTEFLVFAELLTSSIIYQWSAYNIFKKKADVDTKIKIS